MRLEILSLEKAEDKKEDLNVSPNAAVFKVEVGDKETGDVYTVYATIEYREDNGDHRLVLDGFAVSLDVEDENLEKKYEEIVNWVLEELKESLEQSINAFVKSAEKLIDKGNRR